MTKIARLRGVFRVISGLAIGLVLGASIQAAELQDFRLGVSEKRTRLVYQLDKFTSYDINHDESSVSIRFDSLTVSAELLKKFEQNIEGALGKATYSSQGGGFVFSLTVKEPFYIRYFDLVKPERLVIDLYPRSPKVAAETTPEKRSIEQTTGVAEKQQASEKETVIEKPPEADEVTQADTTGKAVWGDQPAQPVEEPGEGAQKAQPPAVIPTAGRDSINLLYIILPVVIVLLLLIGLLTLRRASKRVEFQGEDLEADETWPYEDDKFKKLEDTAKSTDVEEIEVEEVDEKALETQTEPEEPEAIKEEPTPSPTEDELDKIKSEFVRSQSRESGTTLEESEPSPEGDLEQSKSEGISDSEEDLERSEETGETVPEELSEVEADLSEAKKDLEPIPEEKSEAAEEKQPISESDETPAPETEGYVVTEEPVRRKVHSVPDEDSPDLDFEEGTLVWPVYISDGDRPGRIMVVDDEPEIVATLEKFLSEESYDVLGCTDSSTAVDQYKEWHPDLVITDVVMPQFSGVDLVQKIREQNGLRKVIFLSGKTERDSVSRTFPKELEDGHYEFFRKPISLVQIGGRIRDYFTSAQEILQLDLRDAATFGRALEHLAPYQLVSLQRFLWDKIFEISSSQLGRRIEPYFITDRMEPAANYMRRMGCQEREDYCIANVCFNSNPSCAATKIRSELEVMRQIIAEFRDEYQTRESQEGDREGAKRSIKRRSRPAPREPGDVEPTKIEGSPPPRRTLRRLVPNRKR